jgi:WD40 repeat protein
MIRRQMPIWLALRRALLLAIISLPLIAADHAPAQRTLKTYFLSSHLLLAGEISPDETKVAAVSSPENKLQVWDFRSGALVAEAELPAWTVEAGVPQVSYSAQGDLLVVCVERVLHVFRSGDLKEVRQIVIPDEVGAVRYKGHYKPSEGHTSVKSVQLSPITNVAAVEIGHLALGDRLEIYDLTTGAKMRSWSVGPSFAGAEAWHPDGKRVFVVTGDWTRKDREIVEFDIATDARAVRLLVTMPVSSIAVTSDQRVYVVDGRQKGALVARDPTLQVFDLASGKMVHEFGGRGNGVRYHLSVSRDGRRLVAFTGKEEMKFDWEYSIYVPYTLDRTLSVWDLQDNQGIVTSQDLQSLEHSFFSISPAGHFVVVTGQHSQVVELP